MRENRGSSGKDSIDHSKWPGLETAGCRRGSKSGKEGDSSRCVARAHALSACSAYLSDGFAFLRARNKIRAQTIAHLQSLQVRQGVDAIDATFRVWPFPACQHCLVPSSWLFSCWVHARMGSVSAGIPWGARVILLCRTSTSRTRPAQQLDGGRPTTSRRTLSRRNPPVLSSPSLQKMDARACR